MSASCQVKSQKLLSPNVKNITEMTHISQTAEI